MGTFTGFDPRTGRPSGREIEESTQADVQEKVAAAVAAFDRARRAPVGAAAPLLDALADELDAVVDAAVTVAERETALGPQRLRTEMARTTGQLRMFADLVEEGWYVEARIDQARPDLVPPRPDLRRMLFPVGPVAVFAASNFPFAFSVPGGDTASALAAGCPVVVKAHPSHPETSELCADALERGLSRAGAPPGMFSMVQGVANEVGEALVTAEGIKAVGFTGSLRGGRALFDLAAGRPEPIPVYAEMGSINPVFVTQAALQRDTGKIAEGFAGSMTLGTGQFCTKPGLVFVPDGEAGRRFAQLVSQAAQRTRGTAMLNARMRDALAAQVERTSRVASVERLTGGGPPTGPGFLYPTTVLTTDAETFLGVPELAEEHFGPFALVVRYRTHAQMLELANSMQGSLTATLHADREEAQALEEVVVALRQKAGRLIWNGYPTGVAVAHAMHHGGPWPATTFSEHTSVGSAAIRRFLRPVAFQDYPEELLPPPLRDENPRRFLRLIDGEWTREPATQHPQGGDSR